jgi:RNA polymerase sigma factor (sigma-70 family)
VNVSIETGTHRQPGTSSSDFGAVYRANVAPITAYFARRCGEPQLVADLTSETFVAAIGSFHGFDPARGSTRAWLFGIARIVFARHCAAVADGQALRSRLTGQMVLDGDEIEDLAGRIDAQRAGRGLLARCAQLPDLERAAIELVDIDGLTPREAAAALKVSPGALRVRLYRARTRLRKQGEVT